MSAAVDTVVSARSSLDSTQGVQNGPIPAFDYHLRVLGDSYISFFQERKRIEEIYIESLTKLYRKAHAIDTWLDDHIESTSTRAAWTEIRENVDREIQGRQGFLQSLVEGVLAPLNNLKDVQERTRKRVKEELKASSSSHTEYADQQLPKLKRTYLRKCQEVEDLKHSLATSPPPTTGPRVSQDDHFVPLAGSRSNPGEQMKPPVTAPRPLRPLERRPSGGGYVHRSRSPGTSTALQDLAQQGKKQLSQLRTFLDKGGTMKEGTAGGKGDYALRLVRLKRECGEADREYRKGVHWLETLRIHRVKTLEAGYNSLEGFIHEAADTVKKVLVNYTDSAMGMFATQTQLAQHARNTVEHISPSKDTAKLAAAIPRSFALAIPKPVLYHNYHVGECKDLIFGVTLVDYATARGLPEGEIPKIVKLCVSYIDERGLGAEGIYRVSGRHAIVQELQHKMERNEEAFTFNPDIDDVYSVASFLGLYLRQLPEPLFKFPLQDRVQHTEDLATHLANGFVLLRSKIRRLPTIHRHTLRVVIEHLARVAAHSEKNKMDAKNLAIAFGTAIFGEEEIPQNTDLLTMQSWKKDTLMEDFIDNAAVIFEDRPTGTQPVQMSQPPTPAVDAFPTNPMDNSPPLPQPPSGEPTPFYPYGSSHTKVATVPPPISTPASRHEPLPNVASHASQTSVGSLATATTTTSVTTAGTASSHHSTETDFTPRLPPRPTDSIHPSARSVNPGNMSPTKARFTQARKLPPSSFVQHVHEKDPDVVETGIVGRQTPPSPTKAAALERAMLARQLSEVDEAVEDEGSQGGHSARGSHEHRRSSRMPTFSQTAQRAVGAGEIASSPASPTEESVYMSAPGTPDAVATNGKDPFRAHS